MKQVYSYRAVTAQVKVLVLSFEFIDNLPLHFINKLAFINRCHGFNLQMVKTISLPKIIRPTCYDQSIEINGSSVHALDQKSHLAKKIKSIH